MTEVVIEEKPKLTCGIVMPISAIDGCPETHWLEVKSIITDAISEAGFVGELVSQADYSSVIHDRIIQNLYNSDIVVCDVSCKNANVMFELGIRLAFNKPTIIIKDDKTGYSFDTSPIEHLEYPRDLRFARIVSFKEELAKKISGTYAASLKDDYKPFLQNFGQFTVAKLDRQEVGFQDYIIKEFKRIGERIDRLSDGIQVKNLPPIESYSERSSFKNPPNLIVDSKGHIVSGRVKYNLDISDGDGRLSKILSALKKAGVEIYEVEKNGSRAYITVATDLGVHNIDKIIAYT